MSDEINIGAITEALNDKADIDLNNADQTILIYTGMISSFAIGIIPKGWLKCDGSTISRTTYKTLFNIIGTTYGAGDGSTTFALPNLANRVPMMLDSTNYPYTDSTKKEYLGYLPNITGTLGNLCVSVSGSGQTPGAPSGAFSATRTAVGNAGNEPGSGRWIGYLDSANINASRSNSTYGRNSLTYSNVIPASIGATYCIKY